MRAFAKPSGLERLSLEARIVYTGFAVFMLLGYATAAWLYLDSGIGARAGSAAAHYLGEVEVSGSAPGLVAGPAVDLPEELAGAATPPLRLPKPPRQVIETFHFHLFSVPVCLLIIAHLFMMTALSTPTKAWAIGLTTAATLVHLVLPPLIRFASPEAACLMLPSAIAMGAGWIVLTIWPVAEMWR